MSKAIPIPAYIPDIAGTFKDTAEGGARIIFELSPGHAALFYAWKVANDTHGKELTLTVRVV